MVLLILAYDWLPPMKLEKPGKAHQLLYSKEYQVPFWQHCYCPMPEFNLRQQNIDNDSGGSDVGM